MARVLFIVSTGLVLGTESSGRQGHGSKRGFTGEFESKNEITPCITRWTASLTSSRIRYIACHDTGLCHPAIAGCGRAESDVVCLLSPCVAHWICLHLNHIRRWVLTGNTARLPQYCVAVGMLLSYCSPCSLSVSEKTNLQYRRRLNATMRSPGVDLQHHLIQSITMGRPALARKRLRNTQLPFTITRPKMRSLRSMSQPQVL